MKPDVSRSATVAVLADIARAVRPVEMARTAAAVERVLSSCAPSLWGEDETAWVGSELTRREFGLTYAGYCHDRDCPCWDEPDAEIPRDGIGLVFGRGALFPDRWDYAPELVSPHLFPEETS